MSRPETEDERRPLLAGARIADSGTIERDAERADPDQNVNNVEQASSVTTAAAAAADNDEPGVTEEPTTAELLKVMPSIYFGTFLAALDSTLVATLATPISASFDSLSLLSWLASAYFIANAALQPLAGKLTDIFGRRAGLVFSNIFFAAGNLICGLAGSEQVMILGRVVAGMGGGGLTAISTFVASDLVPLRRRGLWQGFGNISFGAGAGLGGLIGGWLNDTVGWRWAFLVQVPLTLLSMLIIIFTVRIPVKDSGASIATRLRRIDVAGALLLVLTLVLLLLGLNSGGNVVPWSHPLVLATLPLGAATLVAYVYVEARVAREPVIPVKLLTSRTTLAACLTNWFVTMAVFGMLFYVPVCLQARGYSATAAGARLAANSAGVATGSLLVGTAIRALGRYWWLNVGVQATLVAGFVLLAATLPRQDLPDWPPFVYLALIGTGYSGMLTVSLISLISAVEQRFQAVITSASYAFRSTGSTIGIAVASAVFQNVLSAALWRRLGDREDAGELIPAVRKSLDVIRKLPEEWRGPVVDCYMEASRAVFVTLIGLCVLGSLCSLFIKEHRLHNTVSRRDE